MQKNYYYYYYKANSIKVLKEQMFSAHYSTEIASNLKL